MEATYPLLASLMKTSSQSLLITEIIIDHQAMIESVVSRSMTETPLDDPAKLVSLILHTLVEIAIRDISMNPRKQRR